MKPLHPVGGDSRVARQGDIVMAGRGGLGVGVENWFDTSNGGGADWGGSGGCGRGGGGRGGRRWEMVAALAPSVDIAN